MGWFFIVLMGSEIAPFPKHQQDFGGTLRSAVFFQRPYVGDDL